MASARGKKRSRELVLPTAGMRPRLPTIRPVSSTLTTRPMCRCRCSVRNVGMRLGGQAPLRPATTIPLRICSLCRISHGPIALLPTRCSASAWPETAAWTPAIQFRFSKAAERQRVLISIRCSSHSLSPSGWGNSHSVLRPYWRLRHSKPMDWEGSRGSRKLPDTSLTTVTICHLERVSGAVFNMRSCPACVSVLPEAPAST